MGTGIYKVPTYGQSSSGGSTSTPTGRTSVPWGSGQGPGGSSMGAPTGTKANPYGSDIGNMSDPDLPMPGLGRPPGSTRVQDPVTREWRWDYPGGGGSPTSTPTPAPYSPGGGGWGGGGGGGALPVDMASILKLLGRKPNQYTWNDYEHQDYAPGDFREWDDSRYGMMRQGITQGLAADAATGAGAYGDARTELQQYQNPFAGRDYTTNEGIPGAMQRMLQANNSGVDAATTGQGVQADAAFGNVLELLGGAANQRQASDMRALGGDERRFNESLASEGRTMGLQVGMAEAAAKEAYDREKWQFGEEIAQMNYKSRMEAAKYNNQGQNQTGQANTQLGNDSAQSASDALIQLLASGQKIDAAQLAAFMGG